MSKSLISNNSYTFILGKYELAILCFYLTGIYILEFMQSKFCILEKHISNLKKHDRNNSVNHVVLYFR